MVIDTQVLAGSVAHNAALANLPAQPTLGQIAHDAVMAHLGQVGGWTTVAANVREAWEVGARAVQGRIQNWPITGVAERLITPESARQANPAVPTPGPMRGNLPDPVPPTPTIEPSADMPAQAARAIQAEQSALQAKGPPAAVQAAAKAAPAKAVGK